MGRLSSYSIGGSLQCGHGEFAVENPSQPREQKETREMRFNAATANSPWRTLLSAARC